MQSFDWLSIVMTAFLVISLLSGLRRGFFRQIADIAGIVLGFLLASKFYVQAGQWLSGFIGQLNEQVLYVIGFIAVFAVTLFVMEIAGFILSKVFALPGLNIINGLAGAVIGLVMGAAFFGIVLSLVMALEYPAVNSAIEASIVPHFLVTGISWAYEKIGFAIPQLDNAIPLFKGFKP